MPPAAGSRKKTVAESVEKEEARFDATINAILDSLPIATYSPTCFSSDDEPAAGSKQSKQTSPPRGCGGGAAPGVRVFKKARRGATKTTLRLQAGLDDKKEVPSSSDNPVSSPDKPGYDSEFNDKEVNDKEVNDNLDDKEVDDNVNEDDDA